MRDPIPPSSRRTTRQPGMAMIALITLLALLSAYLISTLLSRTSSEVLVDRSQRAQDALLKAKAALIAFAADTTSTAIQPGALPCPDTNDDGNAEGSCSGTNVVLGRLPWKTLGVDDIRDASGERLWYALSPRFRKMSSTVVNSDTRGQLTITDGTASSGNIIAVVIAPGPALGAQLQLGGIVDHLDTHLRLFCGIADRFSLVANVFQFVNRARFGQCFICHFYFGECCCAHNNKTPVLSASGQAVKGAMWLSLTCTTRRQNGSTP